MGLFQELTRYLKEKSDEGLITKDKHLEVENEDLKEENFELKILNDKFQRQRDIALDEISLCQKRIDSLLRQLSEKNGGK